MSMYRFIQLCGEHPFATGLLALVGLFGTIFSLYAFQVDQENGRQSTQQVYDIDAKIDKLFVELSDRDLEKELRKYDAPIDDIVNLPQFACLPEGGKSMVSSAVRQQFAAKIIREQALQVKSIAEKAAANADAGVPGYGSEGSNVVKEYFSGQMLDGERNGYGVQQYFSPYRVGNDPEVKYSAEYKYCSWNEDVCEGVGVLETGSGYFFEFPKDHSSIQYGPDDVVVYGVYLGSDEVEKHPDAVVYVEGEYLQNNGYLPYEHYTFTYMGHAVPYDSGFAPDGYGVLKVRGTRFINEAWVDGQIQKDFYADFEEELYASFFRGRVSGYYIDVVSGNAGQVVADEDVYPDWADSCFQ